MAERKGWRVVRGSALFVGALFLSLLLPFVAIALNRVLPVWLGNHLFFAPQNLFAFGEFVAPVPTGFTPALSAGLASALMVTAWAAAAVMFGLVARRLPVALAFLAAPLAIVVVALVVHLLFGAFGYTMQLDGP